MNAPARPAVDIVDSVCPHDCPSTCALEVERRRATYCSRPVAGVEFVRIARLTVNATGSGTPITAAASMMYFSRGRFISSLAYSAFRIRFELRRPWLVFSLRGRLPRPCSAICSAGYGFGRLAPSRLTYPILSYPIL